MDVPTVSLLERSKARRKSANGRRTLSPEMMERLFGPGNAYEGAQEVIAKAKAAGTWFDPDEKRQRAQQFKLNRRTTKKRIAVLERRLNETPGEAKVAPRVRPRIARKTAKPRIVRSA
jgi:hypothetical protein